MVLIQIYFVWDFILCKLPGNMSSSRQDMVQAEESGRALICNINIK